MRGQNLGKAGPAATITSPQEDQSVFAMLSLPFRMWSMAGSVLLDTAIRMSGQQPDVPLPVKVRAFTP